MLLAIALCGCYDRHNEPPKGAFIGQDNCDVVELRALCKDGCYNIERDMICEARVTSSDSEGNFYRSIVVEDKSGAAEIKLGIYNSASQYPVGLVVKLHLKGTAVIEENGVVQVGLPPQSYDVSPLEIESPIIIDKHIVRSNTVEPIIPRKYDIASLDRSLGGRFIAVEGLHYSPLTDTEGLTSENSYYRFTDSNDNVIFVYISPYADFADMEMPTSGVSIQGILYYETVGMGIGNQFVIRPRFAEDISVTNSTL